MYLSYKLQYTYQFTIDSPTTFWQIESGSFKYKEKLMGHYESKLSKVKGNTNPQQRSFVILQLNFLRKQKGGAPHYTILLGERDVTTQVENGKIVATSGLYKSKIGKLYQRQGGVLTIG
ncbi:MAG: hypothetical protein IPP04_01285 [Saprospiraceae bacterium]|nr:hypothetical protein [Saprospiraceae bacterium]